MASPKLEPVVLSDDERQVLEGQARRPKTAQALAPRSRFLHSRLTGLNDEQRPGRPRTITDEQVEKVVTATLEQEPPGGDTHWSTRSMARSAGLNQTAISRIWRAFGLKPHLVQTWKLSTDP
jgi:Homeodomain-like domain